MATATNTAPKPATTGAPAPAPAPGATTAAHPQPLGTMRVVAGVLQAPTKPNGIPVGAHARAQRMPVYTQHCVLVPLVAGNPKRAGAKCHAWYAQAMPVLGTKGCTVQAYTQAMAQGAIQGVPVGAEIAWHVRAGYWGLRPAKGSPAAQAIAALAPKAKRSKR